MPVESLLVEGNRADAYQFPPQTITITPCPPYFFEYEAARTRLCRLFGVQSLEAYGCADAPQAVCAAGAIGAHLEKMNIGLLSVLTRLRSYCTADHLVVDGHSQRHL